MKTQNWCSFLQLKTHEQEFWKVRSPPLSVEAISAQSIPNTQTAVVTLNIWFPSQQSITGKDSIPRNIMCEDRKQFKDTSPKEKTQFCSGTK